MHLIPASAPLRALEWKETHRTQKTRRWKIIHHIARETLGVGFEHAGLPEKDVWHEHAGLREKDVWHIIPIVLAGNNTNPKQYSVLLQEVAWGWSS